MKKLALRRSTILFVEILNLIFQPMTFHQFISRFPSPVKTANGYQVRCPAHDDAKPSLSVAESKKTGNILLKCQAGCDTKEIVTALGLTEKDLFKSTPAKKFTPKYKTPEPAVTKVKPAIEKTYSYTNARGKELYQAVRLQPKSFRQRHRGQDGKWIWNMEGVERVLYRLPEVIKAQTIWIVEGEKDADNLVELGLCATCNVGGAKKWLDGYSEFLSGKDIIICGDSDEVGQEHVEMVFESVAPKARTIKIIDLPVKDVSDFIAGKNGTAKSSLDALVDLAVPHYGGVKLPIYTMAEIEPKYIQMLKDSDLFRLDLGDWLPTLRGKLRPLIPGDVFLVLGDTGTGKTAVLQNIARCAGKLKTLFFEIELPGELFFERQISMENGVTGMEVEESYRKDMDGISNMAEAFPNLYVCPESKLTLQQFESVILKSELKIGAKPNLVLLDYAQLVAADGSSRYEKTSNVAEGIKVIAKATHTIIGIASQVQRPSKDGHGIGIHSGKDSGALENSAGVVLGATRDNDDRRLMHIKVLKATRGGAGTRVVCNFDGAKTLITESSTQEEEENAS